MKPMKTLAILIAAFAWTSLPLAAQAPAPAAQASPSPAPAAGSDPFEKKQGVKPPPDSAPSDNICFTVEIYSLSKEDAEKLLEENSDDAKYQRALELATAGKAHFETLLSVVTRSGVRAVVEQVDELRNPTEFHSPLTPAGPPLPVAY